MWVLGHGIEPPKKNHKKTLQVFKKIVVLKKYQPRGLKKDRNSSN